MRECDDHYKDYDNDNVVGNGGDDDNASVGENDVKVTQVTTRIICITSALKIAREDTLAQATRQACTLVCDVEHCGDNSKTNL